MTEFRTPVDVTDLPRKTGYGIKNLFMGSCFTENIGEKMASLYFEVDMNPFGILYNPVSISQAVKRIINGKPFGDKDLFQYNGLWHSFMHHGCFSNPSATEVVKKINGRLAHSFPYLAEAGFLFVTLGTAWIYELKSTGEIVANCHKVPAGEFRKFRLTVSETVDALKDMLGQLWKRNPGIYTVFTVSPIRHTSDGAVENQLSKSTLLLAVDALIKGFGQDRCAYFPSYELVMDELRDYRFYAADMVHLSDVAIKFIWEKFCLAAIDQKSIELACRFESVNKSLQHRPFNRFTLEHYRFLEQTLKKILALSVDCPYIGLKGVLKDIQDEMNQIKVAVTLPD